jgi:hypothetical protein
MNNSADSVNKLRSIRRLSENEIIISDFNYLINQLLNGLDQSFTKRMENLLNESDTAKIAQILNNLCFDDYTDVQIDEKLDKVSDAKFSLNTRIFLNNFLKSETFTSLPIKKQKEILDDIQNVGLNPDAISRRWGLALINRELNSLKKTLKSKVDKIVADKSIPYTTAKLLANLPYEPYEVKNINDEVVFTMDLSKFLANYYSSEEFKQNTGNKYESIKFHLNSFGL